MNNNEKKIEYISNKLLYEILFAEKKNFNTKELKEADMIKMVKKFIEKEVNASEVQKNETE